MARLRDELGQAIPGTEAPKQKPKSSGGDYSTHRSHARKRDQQIGGLSQSHKDRISASMIENRLHDHASGQVELSATQIKALEILLDRRKPKLSAVDSTVHMQESFSDTLKRIAEARERGKKADVVPIAAPLSAEPGDSDAEDAA